MPPRTRYASSGEHDLAYQVVGEGPVDIVVVPSFVSNLEIAWTHPGAKAWLDRLSSFARVVLFDKAGTGLSDPVAAVPTLEERADEVEVIMDTVGVERAALLGISEGGPSSILLATCRPERVQALVLLGTFPQSPIWLRPSLEETLAHRVQLLASGDKERYLPSVAQCERIWEFQRHVLESWGDGEALKRLTPDQGTVAQLGMVERMSASPGMARATLEAAARIDVTELLAGVRAPTLVVHARDDLVPVQSGRLLADGIPGARLLEIEGRDHVPWLTDPDRIGDEIEELLTGARHAATPDRVLATVMFTDIVSSTSHAANIGDTRWRAVLERHDEITREHVDRFAGTLVKSTGDGALATFDGPARGIRCAEAIVERVADAGIELRAGLHTGECERFGDDIGGLAVHIAARVNALAAPGEVLVSRTVRDLVVGSGIGFSERGVHELKGVPGSWELLAVGADADAGPTDPDPVAGLSTPGVREAQRPSDRVFTAVARRAPGVLRGLSRVAGRRVE